MELSRPGLWQDEREPRQEATTHLANTIHSLTHPPLTRVDFPTGVKPPTYQCQPTTCQSPSHPH